MWLSYTAYAGSLRRAACARTRIDQIIGDNGIIYFFSIFDYMQQKPPQVSIHLNGVLGGLLLHFGVL